MGWGGAAGAVRGRHSCPLGGDRFALGGLRTAVNLFACYSALMRSMMVWLFRTVIDHFFGRNWCLDWYSVPGAAGSSAAPRHGGWRDETTGWQDGLEEGYIASQHDVPGGGHTFLVLPFTFSNELRFASSTIRLGFPGRCCRSTTPRARLARVPVFLGPVCGRRGFGGRG